ncbi:MAG: thioredoxin [Rhodospirillales bacterium]
MEFTLNPDGTLVPDEEAEDRDKKADAPDAGAERPVQAAETIIGGAPAAEPAPGLVAGEAKEAPAGGGDLIKDSSTANFMADVIEASSKVPVVVDFWAPWCGPCKQLGPALEKLVREAAGMVRLVKINVDENQELAAQMRIQSIPAVYAFKNGQPVDGFMGALPDSQLKTFISRLTGGAKSPVGVAIDEAKAALEAGDAMTAGAIFAKVQGQDPTNEDAIAGLIRVAVATGDLGRAREIIAGLPPDLANRPGIAAAVSAVELSEESGESGDVEEFRAKLEADGNDHRARFDLAMALYGQGRNDAAVDELLDLFRRDHKWNDEAARKQLVKIFDALGPADPLTVSGRRRLSSLLFS